MKESKVANAKLKRNAKKNKALHHVVLMKTFSIYTYGHIRTLNTSTIFVVFGLFAAVCTCSLNFRAIEDHRQRHAQVTQHNRADGTTFVVRYTLGQNMASLKSHLTFFSGKNLATLITQEKSDERKNNGER
jgi:hypothetical protein